MARICSPIYGVSKGSGLSNDLQPTVGGQMSAFTSVQVGERENEIDLFLHIGGGVGFVLGVKAIAEVPELGEADRECSAP